MFNFYIIILFVLLIITFLLSMFFSASENSFIQLNKFKIKNLIYKNKKIGREIYKILSNMDLFLSTILVGNNFAIFGFTSISLLLLLKFGIPKAQATTYNLIFSTLLILLFAEIAPKNIGRERSHYFSYKFYPLLKFFQRLFLPITYPVSLLIKLIYSLFNITKENRLDEISKKEIYTLTKSSGMKGLFPNFDTKMIERIFNFRNKRIYDAIIPLNETQPISSKKTINNVKKIFSENDIEYLPVYKNNITNIIGYTKPTDLLNIKNKELPIREIMRDLIYIPEFINLLDILDYFEEEFVLGVIDEYGIVSGLITLNDVIDEILGEEENIISKKVKADNNINIVDEIIVSGKTPLEQLKIEFGIDIKDKDVNTLAGFLMKTFKKIPSRGTTYKYGNYQFKILKSSPTKIKRIKIKNIS
ncbi:MAG: HlyC/CorC family transporter [Candidatus Mcinerneyibacterium aminivorans]|uniref:HlyC/CorC family transporter n=1 Tax=Candidatus Mcinerneyibacterium aminivorans TaxID=2703815 RepID=A0A5D0MIS6_9BACT|nr:MAG: HlyC/CorC family transporter [Candidatus Mcinerneyibacterium aminivorans]